MYILIYILILIFHSTMSLKKLSLFDKKGLVYFKTATIRDWLTNPSIGPPSTVYRDRRQSYPI